LAKSTVETDNASPASKYSLDTLVRLLQEAAHLEHCLLNAYLYTACSIKCTPQEYETVDVAGRKLPNLRRAVQFERARAWKLAMLSVAREEMQHLHLVQCMLRALGKPSCFTLPERDGATGGWRFLDWRMHISGGKTGEPTIVPLEPISLASVRRFREYESTNSFQDAVSARIHALEEQIVAQELDLLIETTIMAMPATSDTNKQRIERVKKNLKFLYSEMPPRPKLLHDIALRGSRRKKWSRCLCFVRSQICIRSISRCDTARPFATTRSSTATVCKTMSSQIAMLLKALFLWLLDQCTAIKTLARLFNPM
jgi:hypothetical protein